MNKSGKSICFLVLLVVVFVSIAWDRPTPGMTLAEIAEKFNDYILARPQEKIYLQLDKPLYAAGEDIWFSTYLVDASYHRPDSLSKVVYVELFNPSKKLIRRRTLYSPGGISHGDFHLADTLPQGNYVLRAYTNNMRNTEEGFFFLATVTVLNPTEKLDSDANHEPLPIDDIGFFPEGGNLLAGVENRVAFKSTTRNGRGIAVEGTIVNDAGKIITTFKSEYDGMGVFKITPLPNIHYFANIQSSNRTFPLPNTLEKGYMLRLADTRAVIKVLVHGNVDPDASGGISIVAQSRGVICFAAQGKPARSELLANIPKNKLPSGITQITVFDAAGVPQCERLVFVNHENTLNLSYVTNKYQYTSREKVELTVEVKNKAGIPVKGNFSMSVYDESKIQSPSQYPLTLANHLLLTSDLRGYIDEPGYYLKDTLPATKSHADLLMMTHGWRRFIWKEVLTDTLEPLPYAPERGIRVSGKVMSTSKKPAANSTIKIITSAGDIMVLTTNSNGRFYDDGLLYYDSTQLVIETDDAKGRRKDLGFVLDPFNTMTGLEFAPEPFEIIEAQAFLDQTNKRKILGLGKGADDEPILLKEVVVKAAKLEALGAPFKLYGEADATISMKDLRYQPISILQALQGRVAGVLVQGAPGNETVTIRGIGSITAGSGPLFLLDGMPVDIDFIRNYPVSNVASIDVLKGPSTSMYGSRGGMGVIAIISKRGADYDPQPAYGIHYTKYPGLYKAREFYSPRYDVSDSRNDFRDIRNTLYWNPSIKTDSNGLAHLSFFTSDVIADYRVVIEGISSDGIPAEGRFKISMR